MNESTISYLNDIGKPYGLAVTKGANTEADLWILGENSRQSVHTGSGSVQKVENIMNGIISGYHNRHILHANFTNYEKSIAQPDPHPESGFSGEVYAKNGDYLSVESFRNEDGEISILTSCYTVDKHNNIMIPLEDAKRLAKFITETWI